MLTPGPHVLSRSSTNTASTTDSSTTPTTPANRKTYVAISLTSTFTTDSTPMASAVPGVWVNTTSEFFVCPPSVTRLGHRSLLLMKHGKLLPLCNEYYLGHYLSSKKLRAPSTGVSPLPEDYDTYVGKEAPVKSNGKKAKQ
ncbi:hypothetical protein B0H14DRAFT_3458578 [Mycena olivaceomarginata]|nr:hypothetical protein B0H14DRAFT_3458578 [Mycena olivaceomarginata]